MVHPTLIHDLVTVERRMADLYADRRARDASRWKDRPAGRRGSRRGVITGRWRRRPAASTSTAPTAA